MLLLWPYWIRVLGGFPGLRVVLLTLVRSPHEVAMSIFLRGKGRYAYHDALAVTAVNLRRLQEIRRTWRGEQVLLRFDPQTYAEDMRLAVKVCGLSWQEAAFQEVFDPICKHHDPTRVEHEVAMDFRRTQRLAAVVGSPRVAAGPCPGRGRARETAANMLAITSGRDREPGTAHCHLGAHDFRAQVPIQNASAHASSS